VAGGVMPKLPSLVVLVSFDWTALVRSARMMVTRSPTFDARLPEVSGA